MSMRTYVVYSSAAFLIDEEIAAYYCLFKDRQDGTIPPEIQALSPEEFQKMAREGTLPCGYSDVDLMDITDAIEMSVVSDFDGNVETLFPDKTDAPLEESYTEAYIGYIVADRELSYFRAAYGSPEELLEEFKEKLSAFHLPDDFDWWKRLVKISGTIFG